MFLFINYRTLVLVIVGDGKENIMLSKSVRRSRSMCLGG